jgi:hypothetical protein
MNMPRRLRSRSTILSLALAFLFASLHSVYARSDDVPKTPDSPSPWGFNLRTYLWLPGITGDISAGPFRREVDANFIDVVGKSRRAPLGFMGRFEAHYDRFAFFVDGNYINLRLNPKFGQVSDGINSELGLMDYGLMYRVFGAQESQLNNLRETKRPNTLDVYVGARTLWLDNSVTLTGPRGLVQISPSVSHSFTSPILGSRFVFDLTPSWFVQSDFNFGGFGAQGVEFTGGIMGEIGYRTSIFNVPTSLEMGYKAVRYRVDKNGPIASNATLNGPFIGLTGRW